jgi:hypothetical protein
LNTLELYQAQNMNQNGLLGMLEYLNIIKIGILKNNALL